jgi:hypothetical protein
MAGGVPGARGRHHVLRETGVSMVCASKAWMCVVGPMGPFPVRNYFIGVFAFAVLISVLISVFMFPPFYYLSFVPISFSVTAMLAFVTCAFIDPGIVPPRPRNPKDEGEPMKEFEQGLFPPAASSVPTSLPPVNSQTQSAEIADATGIGGTTDGIPNQPIEPSDADVTLSGQTPAVVSNQNGNPDTSVAVSTKLVPARHCNVCNIDQLDYMKHCKFCKTCSLELDHHCPIVGTCIAARNKVSMTQSVPMSM